MNTNFKLMTLILLFTSLLLFVPNVQARGYDNLSIAVYFRYQEVHSTPANLERFASQWANVEKQVKVDKVYLETTRNGQLATESDVTTLKKFFRGQGYQSFRRLGTDGQRRQRLPVLLLQHIRRTVTR